VGAIGATMDKHIHHYNCSVLAYIISCNKSRLITSTTFPYTKNLSIIYHLCMLTTNLKIVLVDSLLLQWTKSYDYHWDFSNESHSHSSYILQQLNNIKLTRLRGNLVCGRVFLISCTRRTWWEKLINIGHDITHIA